MRNKRNAAHYNNRGWKNHTRLHSQFKIVKYRRSGKIRIRVRNYLRIPLFRFLKREP